MTPEQVMAEIAAGALVVDLREPGELGNDGMVEHAVHAPRGMLEFWADPSSPYHWPEFDPRRRTVLYCASGGPLSAGRRDPAQLAYTRVGHLDGAMKGWLQAGS